MNIVVLQGTLSSEPIERTIASGVNVMNWEVATVTEHGKQTVPVQWNDPPAAVLKISEGDDVVVLGAVRNRFFRSGGATVMRTEVVASQMAKTSQKASVARLRDRARQALTA